jgi:uncharacterized protein (DUF58 family)
MEFEKVREYQPGDDIRTIDWNVTARMGAPFVKEYREERELTILFIVDLSGSSRFGSQKRFKNEVAAEVTALLAYTALVNNDKIGLIVFTDSVEHFLPPKKGRAHIWRVIRDILSFKPQKRGTSITTALDFVNKIASRRVVAFLISDFKDEGYEMLLRQTARQHDLIAISITDPREMKLPRVGLIALEDAETGEIIIVDTYDKDIVTKYKNLVTQQNEKKISLLRSCGIDHIELSTEGQYVDSLVKFFRLRERRRSR